MMCPFEPVDVTLIGPCGTPTSLTNLAKLVIVPILAQHCQIGLISTGSKGHIIYYIYTKFQTSIYKG